MKDNEYGNSDNFIDTNESFPEAEIRRECGVAQNVDEESCYLGEEKKRIKKPLFKCSAIKLVYFIMLTLSLAYLNTTFIYCFVYSVNLINAYIGLKIPLSDSQVLAVTLELLHPLKTMVVAFMIGLLSVLIILREVDEEESIDLWKVAVKGLIICYVAANTFLVLGVSVHKLDAVGWLFKKVLLDPII